MNVQDAAIQILKDAGKPLHAKEIAERIMEAGLVIPPFLSEAKSGRISWSSPTFVLV